MMDTKQRKQRISNTGLKGVTKHKQTGRFEVRVTVRSKSTNHSFYIGLAGSTGEAVKMRSQFITDLH